MISTLVIFFLESLLISSITYIYLHKKTRISLNYLYKDNVIVILLAFLLSYLIFSVIPFEYSWLLYIIIPFVTVGFAFGLTMVRFWRTPKRKVKAKENELVSPADGNVIYIKKIESGEIPVSIKKGLKAKLNEITETDLIETPCWLIGINMTPFDVHKNCAPISGKVILNKHISGKYLSLKYPKAILENERNTLVIKNDKMVIGVVQTASKLVRRIDSYVEAGQKLNQGEWFGMIRFGSQVDVIIPQHLKINVRLGEQVYAIKTIIATDENSN